MNQPQTTLPSAASEVLDTSMRVTTPENISFEYQLAGPFRRILAYLLDVLVSICGFFAVGGLLYFLLAVAIFPFATMIGGGAMVEAILGLMVGMALVTYFIVYWFYGALMETYYNGQTLGKRWTKMRVLSVDGHSIDGVQAVLRNFFRLLDIAPVVSLSTLFGVEEELGYVVPTCLFGLIMMAFTKRFQRIGDLVAGTVVVTEEFVREPGLVVFTDPRVPKLAELIPNGFVATPSMTKAIADYAEQRRFLPPARANEIAGHLARPLLEQFGLLPDTDYDLFLCSLYHRIFVDSSTSGEPESKGQSGLAITPGGATIPTRMRSPIADDPDDEPIAAMAAADSRE